ncbi:MAG: amidohydrolase family protein [Candidatus Eiseniibacteriota bacterium]
MSLILKNLSLFSGNDLEFVDSGCIVIGDHGQITHVGKRRYDINKKNDRVFDGEGLLACPGFINAHTHIGDSFGKDIGIDLDLDLEQRIHPKYGFKKRILNNSKRDHLMSFMRGTALSMMKRGITAFADFREGEIEGLKLLDDALSGLSIKCIRLGRPEYYFNLDIRKKQENSLSNSTMEKRRSLSEDFIKRASNVLGFSDGFGLSGANENTDESLDYLRKLTAEYKKESKRNIMVGIHAAESQSSVKFSLSLMHKNEVQRILRYLRPDFVVHMTNASDEDVSNISKQGIGVVVCPRSNAILRTGFPDVPKMFRSGCCVGIGTDNVMINSADMFREMEFLWKMSKTIHRGPLSARDVLKMATINGGKILNINSGSIAPKMAADIIFFKKDHIDLAPLHDPYAAVVHRADINSISSVMINGRLVDGDEI